MRISTALLVVAIAIGIALIPTMPYGYYSVMRWPVCGLSAWLAISAYRSGLEGWAWVWGLIAGIYNPIFRVHATRELWSIVNVVTIVIAAWFGAQTRGKDNGRQA
jgi:hypothetical protein